MYGYAKPAFVLSLKKHVSMQNKKKKNIQCTGRSVAATASLLGPRLIKVVRLLAL
jgi:hypothetical protein